MAAVGPPPAAAAACLTNHLPAPFCTFAPITLSRLCTTCLYADVGGQTGQLQLRSSRTCVWDFLSCARWRKEKMLIPNQCCVMCVRILGCSSSWKLTVLLRRRLPRYYAQDLSYLRAPRTWIETLILKKKTEKCFSQDKTQSNSKRRNWHCLQLRLKGQRMRVAAEKWEIHVALLQLCPLMSSVQSGVSASNIFSISHEKVDLWKTGFVPSDWFMTIFGAMGCRHIFPFKHLDLEQLFIMEWCDVRAAACIQYVAWGFVFQRHELPLVWLDLGKNMDSLSFGGPVPSFTLTPCGPWTPCNLYLEYILYLYEKHLLSHAACIVYLSAPLRMRRPTSGENGSCLRLEPQTHATRCFETTTLS